MVQQRWHSLRGTWIALALARVRFSACLLHRASRLVCSSLQGTRLPHRCSLGFGKARECGGQLPKRVTRKRMRRGISQWLRPQCSREPAPRKRPKTAALLSVVCRQRGRERGRPGGGQEGRTSGMHGRRTAHLCRLYPPAAALSLAHRPRPGSGGIALKAEAAQQAHGVATWRAAHLTDVPHFVQPWHLVPKRLVRPVQRACTGSSGGSALCTQHTQAGIQCGSSATTPSREASQDTGSIHQVLQWL